MTLDAIVQRILDWPVLGFVLALILLSRFRDVIRARLQSGAISVKWGDRTIELGELAPEVDQSVDHLQGQIDDLSAQVEQLTEALRARGPGTQGARAEAGELSAFQASRVLQAMQDPRYYARSIQLLASLAGTSEPEMKAMLERMPNVIVGRGKVGDRVVDVARLATRDR